jgi:hypothetical protein
LRDAGAGMFTFGEDQRGNVYMATAAGVFLLSDGEPSTNEVVGTPTPPSGNLDAIEIHTSVLSVNHQWTSAGDYLNIPDSVLLFSAPTNIGKHRGVMRMRANSNGTEFRFQEWSNLDGRHAFETINIVSIPRGQWSLDDAQIEVGTSEISGTGRWKTIFFESGFTTPPTVVASLQTSHGGDAVDVHVRRITSHSMQVALFEEEQKMGSGHATETLGYLLIRINSGQNSGQIDLSNSESTHISLPVKNGSLVVNHNWTNIGIDYQIRLEEDQTADQETSHALEVVNVIKVDNIFLTQISGSAGDDPAVLRSRIVPVIE